MKGYIANIEAAAEENTYFRKVLYTAKHSQLVVMSLAPGESIGMEIHDVDQFIRIESGTGTAVLDGVEHAITKGSAISIPAGTKHNIINGSSAEPMKLYTVYSPPQHKDKIEHVTKAFAEAHDEDFDGRTSE